MKRIEFISPVEAMRGNLSGKQELLYPANDNDAFDAPLNQRVYARNYQPRFIGAKRASDGRIYFAVKTKSAVKMTIESRHAMAVLGGAGAMFGAIVRNAEYYAAIVRAFQIATRDGEEWKSLRAFAYAKLQVMLETKANKIDFGTPNGVFKNPWVDGGTGATLDIPDKVLVKFWSELANQPIYFKVNGLKGVAHSTETFSNVISSNHNVLTLVAKNADGINFVGIGEQFLCVQLEGTVYSPSVNELCSANGGEYYLSDTHGEEIGG